MSNPIRSKGTRRKAPAMGKVKDKTWLALAAHIARGAPCTRSQVGAVLLSRDGGVLATDFNRGGPQFPPCTEGGCPRGRHYRQGTSQVEYVCACGNAWPCPEAVEPGSQYDTGSGRCISVHAETNAILSAGRMACAKATLYCTREPCWWCEKIAMEVKIARIVWPEGEKKYANSSY